MEYRASEALIAKIKEFEGCRLFAYRDSVGKLTIGVGHTQGVRAGMAITMKQAESLLRGDLLPVEKYIRSLGLPLSQAQGDAVCDFCFNLGIDAFDKSTLLQKIRIGAPTAEIQAQFKRWVFAGGKKLKGLEKRRAWEAEQWNK